MSENYYKLTSDGSIKLVTVSERELNLDSSLLTKFAVENPIKVTNLMSAAILPDVAGVGNIGACIKRNAITFTVRLAVLPMRCAFVMKGGYMVPDLKHGNQDPEFVLNWTPPETMRIYFMANFLIPAKADEQFIVAVDTAGRMYRLPLSNLYEDSRLCCGQYDLNGSTFIDMLSKAWSQFNKSRWQSDLADRGTDSRANSQIMFRFKPQEPSGFSQEPIGGDKGWEVLSTRISNQFLQDNIIL